MAIETIYVVNHGGKHHEFKTQKEAEAFEAKAGRRDKLMEILAADPGSHGLSTELMEQTAWYLAEHDRELAGVFADKGKKTPKNAGQRAPRKTKAAAPSTASDQDSAAM